MQNVKGMLFLQKERFHKGFTSLVTIDYNSMLNNFALENNDEGILIQSTIVGELITTIRVLNGQYKTQRVEHSNCVTNQFSYKFKAHWRVQTKLMLLTEKSI